jgi:hypothetical protein
MSVTLPLAAPSSSTSGVSGQTWLLLAKTVDAATATAAAAAVRLVARPRRPSTVKSTMSAAIEMKAAVWKALTAAIVAPRPRAGIRAANGLVSRPLQYGSRAPEDIDPKVAHRHPHAGVPNRPRNRAQLTQIDRAGSSISPVPSYPRSI